MMKHRRSFSHRRKTKVEWWASQQGLGTANKGGFVPLAIANWTGLVPTTTATAVVISTAREAALFNGPLDIPPMPQQLTVHTVRGDILVTPASDSVSPDPLWYAVAFGLIVETENADGTYPFRDPSDPGQGSMPWLWLYNTLVSPRYAGNNSQLIPARIDVHVKTKRVLKDNEALMLHMVTNNGASLSGTAGQVNVRPALRALYSRPL